MAEQQQMSEEQAKELQEKIKNMSPEELKEFQKKQCIFCQIISGNVQSKKVYEDEKALAILDINPANPGHILIMPKEHYSIMPQIPEHEVVHIFNVVKMLSNASLRALEVQGSNIIVANGVAAGQKAQHFMVHLIPRKEGDNVDFDVPQKTIPEEKLEEVKQLLAKALGTKVEQQTPQNNQPLPQSQQLTTPKQEVVEAEFEEPVKDIEKELEELEVKEEKPKKKVPKKPKAKKKEPKEKEQEPKSGANLDDIANILGVK